MHTLQVRELQKKVQSTSRLCRSEKQCWANAGLNPRQCIVLLAVYVLSGFSVLLAVEFLKSKSKRQDMEQHEQERFVEELYLRAEMAVLLKVEDPVTAKDVGIRREAVRFIANYKANGFVQEVSFFECLEKIELYCSKKNNNEKSFSELRFCEMIVLVLAFLDFSDRLQHDVFVNANNDMS